MSPSAGRSNRGHAYLLHMVGGTTEGSTQFRSTTHLSSEATDELELWQARPTGRPRREGTRSAVPSAWCIGVEPRDPIVGAFACSAMADRRAPQPTRRHLSLRLALGHWH